MNRFIKALCQSFAAPFRSLRGQLEEEQPQQLEDNVVNVSEWIGFIGASAWLILSFGRIKWENDDWQAVSTGVLLVMAAMLLIGWRVLAELVRP